MNQTKSVFSIPAMGVLAFLFFTLVSNTNAQILEEAHWTGWMRISQSNCVQRAKNAFVTAKMPITKSESWWVAARTKTLVIVIKCVADDNSTDLVNSRSARMLTDVTVVGTNNQNIIGWRDCIKDFMRNGSSSCWNKPPPPPPSNVRTITWGIHPQGMKLRGKNGQRFRFHCPANGSFGRIWGTLVYTDDSSICTAAVHAGFISRSRGGNLTIEIRPARDGYTATRRNGVQSIRYGRWHGSYVFIR